MSTSRMSVSRMQLAALKHCLARCALDDRDAIKVLWHLLDHSKELTKPVSFTLHASDLVSGEKITSMTNAINDFKRIEVQGYLNELFTMLKSDLRFFADFGMIDVSGEYSRYNPYEEGQLLCAVFWLGGEYQITETEVLDSNASEILNIELALPGLYPEHEEAWLFHKS